MDECYNKAHTQKNVCLLSLAEKKLGRAVGFFLKYFFFILKLSEFRI
jgi:hypothetical protein